MNFGAFTSRSQLLLKLIERDLLREVFMITFGQSLFMKMWIENNSEKISKWILKVSHH